MSNKLILYILYMLKFNVLTPLSKLRYFCIKIIFMLIEFAFRTTLFSYQITLNLMYMYMNLEYNNDKCCLSI